MAEDPERRPVLLRPRNTRVDAACGPERHAFVVARGDADSAAFPAARGSSSRSSPTATRTTNARAKNPSPTPGTPWVWSTCSSDSGRPLERCFPRARASSGARRRLRNRSSTARASARRSSACGDSEPRQAVRAAHASKIQRCRRKRVHLLGCRELRRRDLEVASGAVESAVCRVIARRFDKGSMRGVGSVRSRSSGFAVSRSTEAGMPSTDSSRRNSSASRGRRAARSDCSPRSLGRCHR